MLRRCSIEAACVVIRSNMAVLLAVGGPMVPEKWSGDRRHSDNRRMASVTAAHSGNLGCPDGYAQCRSRRRSSVLRLTYGSAGCRDSPTDVQLRCRAVSVDGGPKGAAGAGRRSDGGDDSGLRTQRQHHALRHVHDPLQPASCRSHFSGVGRVDPPTVPAGDHTLEAGFTDCADQRRAGTDQYMHVPMRLGRSHHHRQPRPNANPDCLIPARISAAYQSCGGGAPCLCA